MINSIEVLELPDSRGESRCYFDRLSLQPNLAGH